jgi:hypothetical protein
VRYRVHKTHRYYEPAESGPHFLSRLSTYPFILALFMLSADTAVSKMSGHMLKRLEFDSRKGQYFPAASKFTVSRPVPVPTKPIVQRIYRFFTFGGRSGAEVKLVFSICACLCLHDVVHVHTGYYPSSLHPDFPIGSFVSDLPTKILCAVPIRATCPSCHSLLHHSNRMVHVRYLFAGWINLTSTISGVQIKVKLCLYTS